MSAVVRRGTAPGRHVYDAIVIGGQLSGALSAALLARRGLQVLHVPHDGLAAPYTHGELSLPHGPFLLPPLRSVPAFDEAVQELGLGPTISRALQLTPLQVLEHDQWFELTHDEKRRGPELARALGAEADTFDEIVRRAESAGDASDRFFQAKLDFPPEGFFGRWGFKRKLAGFPGVDKDSPLPAGSLLSRLTTWLANVDAPAPLTRARVLGRTLAGPALFQGGREGLWNVIAERARELGADVLSATESVERLSFEGATVGVRLARGDTVYRAGFVIAAVDLDVLTRLVPEKQRPAATKIALKASKACVTFHSVLPEKALPRGLGTLALVDSPELEGGLVLLQVSPGPKDDQRVLSATVQASVGLKAGGEPAIRALAAQVHASLARVMPFTRAHFTLESTPWIDAPAIVEGRAEVHPLFTLPPDAWLGVTALATSSPWKRVLFANRQVLPGLGFEGEVLAAQRAVKLVELSLKKNDPLKKGKPA